MKEAEAGTITIGWEKKLDAAKRALELAEVKRAKARSEVESCQKKIQECENSNAQLIGKIEKQDTEIDHLKKEAV